MLERLQKSPSDALLKHFDRAVLDLPFAHVAGVRVGVLFLNDVLYLHVNPSFKKNKNNPPDPGRYLG